MSETDTQRLDFEERMAAAAEVEEESRQHRVNDLKKEYLNDSGVFREAIQEMAYDEHIVISLYRAVKEGKGDIAIHLLRQAFESYAQWQAEDQA